MANEEHVKLLRQDVQAWNEWRAEHPREMPDLRHANLRHVNLHLADLHQADLREADLRQADLRQADLGFADLRQADLREADLHLADLRKANLRHANLRHVNLHLADLHLADLHLANLIQADLHQANLIQADLYQADLRQADLRQADLRQADLHQADLRGARLEETTFANVNLTKTTGLEDCRHLGPSVIDFRTLAYGSLPLVFLRGCGLPDTVIEYLPSLLNVPLQFDSCFISYSSKDEEFAQRLHADLQNKGVRCWFAPEDMKIGDEFRSRIDQAIHVHDRLLLILSEHSVNSRWVQKEVETAFEKEGRDKHLVLFPVRVDSAVMDSKVGWAADVRRQRHIGDFTQWKEHDTYQRAFTRLLRDLKPDAGQGTKQ